MRLWLNWEAFEVAYIHPLFTADISLEKIREVAERYEDPLATISFAEWSQSIAVLFRLNHNQTIALYSVMTCFFTHDAQEALYQAQACRADPVCLHSFTLRVIDVLVFLFVVFVKKKFRNVSERSNMEAFPPKKDNMPKVGHQKNTSLSTPTILLVAAPLSEPTSSNTPYAGMQRFLLSKLNAFLTIFAPHGLTRPHMEALGFLLHGGPTFLKRSDDLAVALNWFQDTEIEPLSKFETLIEKNLVSAREIDKGALHRDQSPSSPFAYRPMEQRATDSVEELPNVRADRALVIENAKRCYIEEPLDLIEVYIAHSQKAKIYVCSAVSTVFISHCKDSVIFLGAATAVHLEYCANVKLIAAARMFHLDSCTRCTTFLLANSRPILTGTCQRLILAPYNAIYPKFGLDILAVGINPRLNFWDQPISIGSLGAAPVEKIAVADFAMFVVPFAFAGTESTINPIVPAPYAAALAQKRATLVALKNDLAVIRERDPDLFQRLMEQIHQEATQSISTRGEMAEFDWLNEIRPA
jgi:hypothetical protein